MKNNGYFVQLYLKKYKNIIKSIKVPFELKTFFLHKTKKLYNFDQNFDKLLQTNKLINRTDFIGFLFDPIMNKILFRYPDDPHRCLIGVPFYQIP